LPKYGGKFKNFVEVGGEYTICIIDLGRWTSLPNEHVQGICYYAVTLQIRNWIYTPNHTYWIHGQNCIVLNFIVSLAAV